MPSPLSREIMVKCHAREVVELWIAAICRVSRAAIPVIPVAEVLFCLFEMLDDMFRVRHVLQAFSINIGCPSARTRVYIRSPVVKEIGVERIGYVVRCPVDAGCSINFKEKIVIRGNRIGTG